MHPRGLDEYRFSHFQKSQEFALGGGVDFNTSNNMRGLAAFALMCFIRFDFRNEIVLHFVTNTEFHD